MFGSGSFPPNRKASRSGSKPTPSLLRNKINLGLAVDTSFSRHRGQAPQRIFPSEPKTQDLSFVGSAEAQAEKNGRKGRTQHFEIESQSWPAAGGVSTSPPASSQNAFPSDTIAGHATASAQPPSGQIQAPASLKAPPFHKRIKGLRPAPLDIAQDISPSDRAITIGITIPSASVSNHTPGRSCSNARSSPGAHQPRHQGPESVTPTIVITPAQEEFEFGLSPDEGKHASGYRPASSVYSRYTDCFPTQAQRDSTPPVPPLPLFINDPGPHEPRLTGFETADRPLAPSRSHHAISVYTTFEEDATAGPPSAGISREVSKRSVSDAHLPTPRRSKGWWNVVTSPFSASSKSSAFFWRSPALPQGDADAERMPMVHHVSAMGTMSGEHEGPILQARAPDDDELRSAPASDSDARKSPAPPLPKRSDTAPGALDASAAPFNIYRIPSFGLAAAYYDPTKHFPSLIGPAGGLARDVPDGWSPSDSVAHVDREREGGAPVLARDGPDEGRDSEAEASDGRSGSLTPSDGSPNEDLSPSGDIHATPEIKGDARQQPTLEHTVFSSPAADELDDAAEPRPRPRPPHSRKSTHATIESHFSPLSATPVVENAHMGRFVGPRSTHGELREVELEPSRSVTPPALGLGAATMAHQDNANAPRPGPAMAAAASAWPQQVPSRPQHTRNESYGLGILDSEKREDFSPPALLSEKPRLGTDRFGQLEIRSTEEKGSTEPWYRRFFWLLASLGAGLLLLATVLLVILVPQTHDDMAVEAQWLNLTGFPALPTGVATVVQPHAIEAQSGCVAPPSLWSCAPPATPPSTGAGADAADAQVPNFRLEIRFRNGTLPANETMLGRRALGGGAARAGAVARRSAWSDALYAASPAVPSVADQLFLGQTTDNVTAPYDGEATPFYISLLDPAPLVSPPGASRLRKRQTGTNPYPYPTPASANTSSAAATNAPFPIPAPAETTDGEPAPAALYPFAAAQPLRLYDRGLATEHYGFYTYFDRTLYVAGGNASTNTSSPGSAAGLGADVVGNVALTAASAVCTWSQTRLHVQIWTRRDDAVAELGTPNPAGGVPAAGNSTAADLVAPGSFPYPVTVTLDRHGGAADAKGVYCYRVDGQGHVVSGAKMWVAEDRAFGGRLVNAAPVPGGNGSVVTRRASGPGYGGVDGGTGGCACSWQNWG